MLANFIIWKKTPRGGLSVLFDIIRDTDIRNALVLSGVLCWTMT